LESVIPLPSRERKVGELRGLRFGARKMGIITGKELKIG
jgi:hypothetical protein